MWQELMALEHWELIGRLLAAAALGSVIGLERERFSWAAGLRTHMLVAVGACMFMIVSIHGFSDVEGMPGVSLDPSRVAAQVVSGIGFLGAGAILMRGEVIKGLTTAASLWSVSAIGLAVGGGMMVEAMASTALILGVLAGIKPLEERYRSARQSYVVQVKAEHGTISFDRLREILGERAYWVKHFVVQHQPAADPAEKGWDDVMLTFQRVSPKDVKGILETLQKIDGVVEAKEGRK